MDPPTPRPRTDWALNVQRGHGERMVPCATPGARWTDVSVHLLSSGQHGKTFSLPLRLGGAVDGKIVRLVSVLVRALGLLQLLNVVQLTVFRASHREVDFGQNSRAITSLF
jgi:hypothetical protein